MEHLELILYIMYNGLNTLAEFNERMNSLEAWQKGEMERCQKPEGTTDLEDLIMYIEEVIMLMSDP